MLTKKKQKKYAKKKWKSVERHFELFCHTQDSEELHKMRLGIKKIRVLLEIYPHTKKVTNQFKPVKKIFKHAGLIRDAHINLQYIKKHKIIDIDLKKRQTKKLEDQTQRFLSRSKEYLKIIKKSRKNIEMDFIDIKSKSILHIYIKHIDKLAVVFIKETQKELHICRKRIKVLLYLYDILNQPLMNKLKLNIVYLDKLQDNIGKWHDTIVAVKFLKTKFHLDKTSILTFEKQIRRRLRTIHSLAYHFEEKVYMLN